MGALPVLVAVAVSKDDVSGELSHDVLGSRVHEIESIDVIGLVEIVCFGESKGENKSGGRVGRKKIPMETTAVDADDNPCVWEERVVLLKELDVLVARLGHGCNGCVEADEQDRPRTAE